MKQQNHILHYHQLIIWRWWVHPSNTYFTLESQWNHLQFPTAVDDWMEKFILLKAPFVVHCWHFHAKQRCTPVLNWGFANGKQKKWMGGKQFGKEGWRSGILLHFLSWCLLEKQDMQSIHHHKNFPFLQETHLKFCHFIYVLTGSLLDYNISSVGKEMCSYAH